MPNTALLERPIREIAAIEPVVMHDHASIIDALAVLPDAQWSVVLITGRHGPKAVTRADVELLLPSPATMLSRHELIDRVDRVSVGEAVRHQTTLVEGGASVGETIEAMREAAWRPVVVMEGGVPKGVHTSASLLAAVGMSAEADETREPIRIAKAAPVPSNPAARANQDDARPTLAPTTLRLSSASAFGMPLLLEAERRRDQYAQVGQPSGLLSDVRVVAGWIAGVRGRGRRAHEGRGQ
jgi:CBS domain-containing protein